MAPEFSLSNQHGETITRTSLLGAPAVLVFYPYAFSGICSRELAELADLTGDLTAAGARVLAISVDTMFALRTFGDQLGLPFDLLSDFWPHGAVADAYQVFDAERGCAIRGSFVLDADGRITAAVRNRIGEQREMADLVGAVPDAAAGRRPAQ